MNKKLKSLWITYWIQLIPSVFSFIISFFYSYFLILRDYFDKPASGKAAEFFQGSFLLSDKLFGVTLHTGTAQLFKLLICSALCFIAIILITFIAKKAEIFISKGETVFIFLPHILFALLYICGFFELEIALFICLAYSLCVLAVEIYLPIKLKKLQKS